MIQDLHSHTYYSFCGEDAPSTIIEAAIAGGVELFGICDHCYGIAQQRPNIPLNSNRNEWSRDYQAAVDRYRDHMTLLKQKYSDRIKLAVGIEIPTIRKDYLTVPEELDLSKFDYCLIEHIDDSESVAKDIFDYAKRYGCKYKGIAHTDIPQMLENQGKDTYTFFKKMAEENIFWEVNVNYDRIHSYREHQYVKRIFYDEALIKLIKESGVKMSVGFDGHRVDDYLPERVKMANNRLCELGIPLIFDE